MRGHDHPRAARAQRHHVPRAAAAREPHALGPHPVAKIAQAPGDQRARAALGRASGHARAQGRQAPHRRPRSLARDLVAGVGGGETGRSERERAGRQRGRGRHSGGSRRRRPIRKTAPIITSRTMMAPQGRSLTLSPSSRATATTATTTTSAAPATRVAATPPPRWDRGDGRASSGGAGSRGRRRSGGPSGSSTWRTVAEPGAEVERTRGGPRRGRGPMHDSASPVDGGHPQRGTVRDVIRWPGVERLLHT